MAMPPWLRRSMVAGSSIVFKIFHLGSIIKVLKLKKKKKKKKKEKRKKRLPDTEIVTCFPLKYFLF
jgi:hypothetical protein